MPVNDNMESILQEKMEQFLLEPDPADWRAIQERLRRKKRRRFLWWVFPLAGAAIIGAGTYLYTGQEVEKLPVAWSTLPASATPETAQQNTGTPATPESISPAPQEEPGDINATPDQALKPQALEDTPAPVVAKAKTGVDPDPVSNAGNHSRNKYVANPGRGTTPVTETGATPTAVAPVKNTDAVPLAHTEAKTDVATWNPAGIDLHRTRPSWQIPASVLSMTHAKGSFAPVQAPIAAVPEKKIPAKTTANPKGWYLGAYLSIGGNHPFEPISTSKSMDFNSGAGVSGSSRYGQTMASWKTGFHSSLGLAIRKKNKNTAFSLGLGLQHNSWEQTYNIYKDSITPSGVLYSRSTVATPNVQYRQLMLEIPAVAEFRIAGRKASSWWIHTGLNNAITLKLAERSAANGLANSPGPSNSLSNADSLLKAGTRGYIPQWRLGLTYERAAKQQHWQLQPYMQLGLQSVTSSGEPDVSLFQWGLQFRYFFKKMK